MKLNKLVVLVLAVIVGLAVLNGCRHARINITTPSTPVVDISTVVDGKTTVAVPSVVQRCIDKAKSLVDTKKKIVTYGVAGLGLVLLVVTGIVVPKIIRKRRK